MTLRAFRITLGGLWGSYVVGAATARSAISIARTRARADGARPGIEVTQVDRLGELLLAQNAGRAAGGAARSRSVAR